jgi:hypothetical protein
MLTFFSKKKPTPLSTLFHFTIKNKNNSEGIALSKGRIVFTNNKLKIILAFKT